MDTKGLLPNLRPKTLTNKTFQQPNKISYMKRILRKVIPQCLSSIHIAYLPIYSLMLLVVTKDCCPLSEKSVKGQVGMS